MTYSLPSTTHCPFCKTFIETGTGTFHACRICKYRYSIINLQEGKPDTIRFCLKDKTYIHVFFTFNEMHINHSSILSVKYAIPKIDWSSGDQILNKINTILTFS